MALGKSVGKPRQSGFTTEGSPPFGDAERGDSLISTVISAGYGPPPIKTCAVKRQQLQSLTGRHRAEYVSASRVATRETADEPGVQQDRRWP
jgi:hypothetical protein